MFVDFDNLITECTAVKSSHPEVFRKKSILENFENLQVNTCVQVSFLIKLQASLCNNSICPADTDVFKTSSGRLKKVTTSCAQTRCRHDVWKKTSELRRLEDV